MASMLRKLPLLVITGWLLLPNSVLGVENKGWYLDTSCNALGPRIRQSYANALSMSQAVINLHTDKDPNFQTLMSYMLGIRAFDPTLVTDAVSRSFFLVKKTIARSLKEYTLTPEALVARHQNILKTLSEEVTGQHKIYRNWMGNVIFYCDKSRYQQKTLEITENGQKKTTLVQFDKTFALDWPHNDPNWNQCFGIGIPQGVPAVTLQYTIQNWNRPDAIQLCPWWLTYTLGWLPPTTLSVKPAWMVNIPAPVRSILDGKDKVDMDVYSQLDRYILKHLLLTYPAKTALGMAVNTGVDGWAAAVAASDRGGNMEAENLSWLAVGAWMIQGPKLMPNAAGGVADIEAAA